jgi:asparagine synthetase B (glutamine-hydrolysing)
MCGLFGVTSRTPLSSMEFDRGIFLGYLSADRGINSTGVLLLGKNDKNRTTYVLEKELMNSVSFFNDAAVREGFRTIKNDFLMMGHTRLSTVGAEIKENAHPILDDNIVLCHNGTIEAFVKNKATARLSDSVEFARRLNSDIPGTLRQADQGHYAVSFVNYRNGTLNLARNPTRPLFVMYTQGKGTVYWASERWMLNALAERDYNNKYEAPEIVPPFELWSAKFLSTSFSVSPLDKHVVFTPPATKFPSTKHKKHVSMAFCATCRKGEAFCTCSKVSVPLIEDKTTDKYKYLYKGWQGTLFPIHLVMPKLRKGCSMCKSDELSKPNKTNYWYSEELFFCEECKEYDVNVLKYIIEKNVAYHKSELVKLHDGSTRAQ